MSKYRPDIDGLRTVAVVPVILFHLGVGLLPGGFIGVDVFFVISGFLITRIIVGEVDDGRFSIAEFYRRRIRRIFPNLFAMILLTTIVAAVLMLPYDFQVFGSSVTAATLSFANFFFWMKQSYFDPLSATMPLLHTWSLGVEEQYYIVFPPLVMAIARWRRSRLAAALWAMAALSFALAVYQTAYFRSAAFYLPFGRWWELMVGSLLAINAVPALRGRLAEEATALAGLLLIVIGMLALDELSAFPGAAALLPTIGTGAIIHANATHRTLVGRVLGCKPMVVIGLLSYSLYLWHWPVIVLTTYALQRPLLPLEQVILLGVIALLATLAWRFVERPLRRARTAPGIPDTRPFAVAGAASAVLVAAGLVAWLTHGVPQRFTPEVQAMARAGRDGNPRRAACMSPSLDRIARGDVCRIGRPGVAPSFAVVGDSLADAFMAAIDARAREAGVAGLYYAKAGCLLLPGEAPRGSSCRTNSDAVFGWLTHHPEIRGILLLDRWSGFFEGEQFGVSPVPIHFASDDESNGERRDGAPGAISRSLRRARLTFPGRTIWIAAFLPEQVAMVPQALVTRTRFGGDLRGVPRDVVDRRQAAAEQTLRNAALRNDLGLIDLRTVFCDARFCPMQERGRPLFVDQSHPARGAVVARRAVFTPFLAAVAANSTPR